MTRITLKTVVEAIDTLAGRMEKRFDYLEQKFDGVGQEFEKVYERFDDVDATMKHGFAESSTRLTSVESRTRALEPK